MSPVQLAWNRHTRALIVMVSRLHVSQDMCRQTPQNHPQLIVGLHLLLQVGARHQQAELRCTPVQDPGHLRSCHPLPRAPPWQRPLQRSRHLRARIRYGCECSQRNQELPALPSNNCQLRQGNVIIQPEWNHSSLHSGSGIEADDDQHNDKQHLTAGHKPRACTTIAAYQVPDHHTPCALCQHCWAHKRAAMPHGRHMVVTISTTTTGQTALCGLLRSMTEEGGAVAFSMCFLTAGRSRPQTVH
jgi:hypothetical protein